MTERAERRCKAVNRRGDPCSQRVVNAAGYCVVHDPERPQDMRELGRKSAKARARPNPDRVHESLREYLKREVPPARVWQALEAALTGQNEAARVSASRVLMDALHEPQQLEEQDFRAKIAAEAATRNEEATRKISEAVMRAVIAIVTDADESSVLGGLAIGRLRDQPMWLQRVAAALDEETKAKIAERKEELTELERQRDALKAELEQLGVQKTEFISA